MTALTLAGVAVRAYVLHGASPRWQRTFAGLAGLLCAGGLLLLAVGEEVGGGAVFGLSAAAFFCSVLFVGHAPDEGEDGGDDGGGPAGPPGDTGGGPVPEWDWELFEEQLRLHARERDTSLR